MSRGSTHRHAQTAGDLGFAVQFIAETFRAAPLSSGRIVPRVTMGKVTPFIPRERPNANTCYFRLFKATTAYTSTCTDAGAVLAPLLSRGTRVCHWQSLFQLYCKHQQHFLHSLCTLAADVRMPVVIHCRGSQRDSASADYLSKSNVFFTSLFGQYGHLSENFKYYNILYCIAKVVEKRSN